MSRFTITLGLVLAVSSCLATSIIAQGDAKGDKDKLQGTWVGTADRGRNGQEDLLEVRIEFKADKFTATFKGGAVRTGTYKTNSEKSPSMMDITVNGETIPAIYELKGNELTICHPVDASRPSALEATEKTVLFTLKRLKS